MTPTELSPSTEQDVAGLVADLRAGLTGVTSGPWVALDFDTVMSVSPVNKRKPLIADMIEQGDAREEGHWGSEFANAAHIARCSPDNIAKLLTALEAKDAALSTLAAERDGLHAGLSAIVHCQSALTRAQMREAAADLLAENGLKAKYLGGDQSPFVRRAEASEARATALEAERDEARERGKDEGVDFVFDELSGLLGVPDCPRDAATETWDGDVQSVLHRILTMSGVIDDETGVLATTKLAAAREALEGDHEVKPMTDERLDRILEFEEHFKAVAIPEMTATLDWSDQRALIDEAVLAYRAREALRSPADGREDMDDPVAAEKVARIRSALTSPTSNDVASHDGET